MSLIADVKLCGVERCLSQPVPDSRFCEGHRWMSARGGVTQCPWATFRDGAPTSVRCQLDAGHPGPHITDPDRAHDPASFTPTVTPEEVEALNQSGQRVEAWRREVEGFLGEQPAPTTSPTEGRKEDGGKSRWDLMPFDALDGVGRVLLYGADKYAPRNWELGMHWGRLLAAALRHLGAWALGLDVDPESGLPHLDHAACCVLMLSALAKRKVGVDDRTGKLDIPRAGR